MISNFFKGHRNVIGLSAFIFVVLIGTHFFLRARGYVWADWTGFGDYTGPLAPEERGKTLWDWMELLVIPIVLAVGAFYFNRQERRNELKIAEDRHKNDLAKEEERRKNDIAIAEERRKVDLEIADLRNQEAALQNYLDKMNELILEKGLMKVKRYRDEALSENDHLDEDEIEKRIPGDLKAARDMAQIRTVTILRQLNETRRNIILQFLRDANLAGFLLVRSTLDHADLTKADFHSINLASASMAGATLVSANLSLSCLTDANLEGVNLNGAELHNANLKRVNLSHGDLSGSNLVQANLSWAKLRGAKLIEANLRSSRIDDAYMDDADLSGADVSEANLTGCTLVHANMSGSKLLETNLTNAKVICANLSGADLCGANLRDAMLYETNLDEADLGGADLTGVRWGGDYQVERAFLKDTIMPDGSKRTNNSKKTDIDISIAGLITSDLPDA